MKELFARVLLVTMGLGAFYMSQYASSEITTVMGIGFGVFMFVLVFKKDN